MDEDAIQMMIPGDARLFGAAVLIWAFVIASAIWMF